MGYSLCARFLWLWYISVLVSQHPPPATTWSLASNTLPLRLTVFLYEGLLYFDWDNWSSPSLATYIHGFRHSYTTPVTSIQLPVNTLWSSWLDSFGSVFLLQGEWTRDVVGLTRNTWFAAVWISFENWSQLFPVLLGSLAWCLCAYSWHRHTQGSMETT